MGRAQARPAPLSLASTSTARHRDRVKALAKPSYKVVIEQVTQQKKKLFILVCLPGWSSYGLILPFCVAQGSFETKPPRGYTFVAAGNPSLTKECKDLARQNSARVFVVSVGILISL